MISSRWVVCYLRVKTLEKVGVMLLNKGFQDENNQWVGSALPIWVQKFFDFLCYNKSKIFIIVVMILFITLTTIGVLHHEPWFDEAQAWLIAQDLGFGELLKYMKYEGHLFMWFLALMPSAKLHLTYPLPMLFTNVIFAWGAVYILLKKSPFHPILKVLITFSLPIAYQYAVLARPYAMGVMFLFALAALYKDKLERPILYSILITLCANTSSMALCGAFAFGVIFLFDYIKSKKEFWKTKEFYTIFSIATFCVAILGYQLLGADKKSAELMTYYLYAKDTFNFFFSSAYNGVFFTFVNNIYYAYIFVGALFILALFAFYKDKRTLFFFYFNYVLLTFIFTKLYNGYSWHHYFYFIYLVISLWIFDKSKSNLWHKILIGLFSFSLIISVISTFYSYQGDITDRYTESKSVADYIATHDKYKNANLVFCDELSHSIVPYLKDKNIKTYNCEAKNNISFFNRKSGNSLQVSNTRLNPTYFNKFTDKDTYVVFYNGRYTKIKNQYFDMDFEYCSEMGIDFTQYCIMKIKRK